MSKMKVVRNSTLFFVKKKFLKNFENFVLEIDFLSRSYFLQDEILVILVKIAKIDQKSDLEWKYDNMFKIKVVQN